GLAHLAGSSGTVSAFQGCRRSHVRAALRQTRCGGNCAPAARGRGSLCVAGGAAAPCPCGHGDRAVPPLFFFALRDTVGAHHPGSVPGGRTRLQAQGALIPSPLTLACVVCNASLGKPCL